MTVADLKIDRFALLKSDAQLTKLFIMTLNGLLG